MLGMSNHSCQNIPDCSTTNVVLHGKVSKVCTNLSNADTVQQFQIIIVLEISHLRVLYNQLHRGQRGTAQILYSL